MRHSWEANVGAVGGKAWSRLEIGKSTERLSVLESEGGIEISEIDEKGSIEVKIGKVDGDVQIQASWSEMSMN